MFKVSIRMLETKGKQTTIYLLFSLMIFMLVTNSSSTTESRAIPEYVRELPKALKGVCKVCHVRASGGPLNSYGDDFESSGRRTSALNDLDSDADGFSNAEELAAGSLPGDQDSTPTSKNKGINLYLLMGGASVLLIIASVAFRARNPPDS
jgi:hypothetical protein|tara:strand:+ start:576 stop:1028 length:453 start_codon:yes stop_codon:yes gene_type:complete